MKLASMRKRYETAKAAVERVRRWEDLHESAGVCLEDALVDLDELIEWAERAALELRDYRENVCTCRVMSDSFGGKDQCLLCEDTAKLLTELEDGPLEEKA